MMTGEQYKESLRQMKINLYFMGEKIENRADHPATRPHVNAAAACYDLAFDLQYQDMASAVSHLTGERINRFTHIHHSVDDLVNKVKMLRTLGQKTASCFQRCASCDGMNAAYGVTYEMDQKKATNYHQRFVDYLKYIQKNDLMPSGSMTDPKGDRSLPPSKQADPDLYLRVVEKRRSGIVVRGAKLHQTGAANAHEMLVFPTRNLSAEDADYAVAFSVPADTKGITLIFGRQTNDSRKLEGGFDQGNPTYGAVGGESTVIFDDVFVPWERVFLCGEHEFTGLFVERFAAYHRQNYGACKVGISDALIGACVALAEIHGVGNAPHIREKLTEMIHLTETLYSCSIACSTQATRLPCGSYYVDPLLANVTKQNVTRFIYEIFRLAQDIAGGFIATMPSEKDFRDPRLGPYLEKYFKAAAAFPTEHRLRLGRFVEGITASIAAVESMHGAGSPQAQRIMIMRQANLPFKKSLALRLAGISKE